MMSGWMLKRQGEGVLYMESDNCVERICTQCWTPGLDEMPHEGFYKCAECGAVYQEMEGEEGTVLVQVSAFSTSEV